MNDGQRCVFKIIYYQSVLFLKLLIIIAETLYITSKHKESTIMKNKICSVTVLFIIKLY